MSTITRENIDLDYALALCRFADSEGIDFPEDWAQHLSDCREAIAEQERRQERDRRVRQAWEAAFNPDPEMRRYSRLERRAESAVGEEQAALIEELDRLGESIYCRKYDC